MSVTLDIWGLLAFGVGAWMILDGLIFGFMPEIMRRLMGQMQTVTDTEMRQAGLFCAVFGAAIVFLITR